MTDQVSENDSLFQKADDYEEYPGGNTTFSNQTKNLSTNDDLLQMIHIQAHALESS